MPLPYQQGVSLHYVVLTMVALHGLVVSLCHVGINDMQKNKTMAPFMDFVMIANTCDDSSTDSCMSMLLSYQAGHTQGFCWCPSSPCACGWVPFLASCPPTTVAIWFSNLATQRWQLIWRRTIFILDAKQYATISICYGSCAFTNLPLDIHVCRG